MLGKTNYFNTLFTDQQIRLTSVDISFYNNYFIRTLNSLPALRVGNITTRECRSKCDEQELNLSKRYFNDTYK